MSNITVLGLVATTPRHLVTQEGLAITSFRIAQATDTEGVSNWYTITAFKTLAINASASINKGDRIIVTGKLLIRDWDNGSRAGTSIEIEAETMGHDLNYGASVFHRKGIPDQLAEDDTPKHECDCDKCDK